MLYTTPATPVRLTIELKRKIVPQQTDWGRPLCDTQSWSLCLLKLQSLDADSVVLNDIITITATAAMRERAHLRVYAPDYIPTFRINANGLIEAKQETDPLSPRRVIWDLKELQKKSPLAIISVVSVVGNEVIISIEDPIKKDSSEIPLIVQEDPPQDGLLLYRCVGERFAIWNDSPDCEYNAETDRQVLGCYFKVDRR